MNHASPSPSFSSSNETEALRPFPLDALAKRGVLSLVEASLHRIQSQEALVPLVFYRRLFQLEPRLRTLFHGDLEVQGRALVDAFSKILRLAAEPGAGEAYARALARRHAAYGVRTEHFSLFARAWMETIAELMPRPEEAAALGAWTEFLEVVARVMSAEVEAVAVLKEHAGTNLKRRSPLPDVLSRPPFPFSGLASPS